MGTKRALTPSDEEWNEEKMSDSEGSAKDEALAMCAGPPLGKMSKKEKLREKRRRKKGRIKVESEEYWWEQVKYLHTPGCGCRERFRALLQQ